MSLDYRRNRSTPFLRMPSRCIEDDRPYDPGPFTPGEAWDEKPDAVAEIVIRECEDYSYDIWEILRDSKHHAASAIRNRIIKHIEEINRDH
jgi:hypothetical protein